MKSAYFDHETEVKYTENVLNKSRDWSWLIEYIEENFEFDFEIDAVSKFYPLFSKIEQLFNYLKSINELADEVNISCQWLIDINQMVLFSLGKRELKELDLKNDFLRLLALYILSAKLANEKSLLKYLIYSEIFQFDNIFNLLCVDGFIEEKDTIEAIINSLDLDFSFEKEKFHNNIEHILYPCTELSPLLKEYCDNPDSFSFRNKFDFSKVSSWEEKYLLDLLSTKYEKGKLIPMAEFDGISIPDFRLYTHEVISKIKMYYKNTDALFLVESAEYALFGKIPSEDTIRKHFELFKSRMEDSETSENADFFRCSSLEFIISFFKDEKIENKPYLRYYYSILRKSDNTNFFAYISNNKMKLTKRERNKIINELKKKAAAIDSIKTIMQLNHYFQEPQITEIVDKKIFEKVSDKFEEILENIDNGNSNHTTMIATLFLNYLKFLIKIQNNRNIEAQEISAEIIYIRAIWKDNYYSICCANMHAFEHETKIPSQRIKSHSELMIGKPLVVACSCLILKEEKAVKALEENSKNINHILFSSMYLNEEFPEDSIYKFDENHPVDNVYKSWLGKIYTKNKYRLMNRFSIDEFMGEFFDDIKNNIKISFALFNATEELYHLVSKNNPEYRLIDYSDKPSLAHLTQLFPIVENRIRKMGENYAISPICENITQYYKLKEPDSILRKIIKFVFDNSGELSFASDFMFIHFVLFAENGLNIRNECVHGKNYITNENEILFAFKVTLFCLHLLDYRERLIRKEIK